MINHYNVISGSWTQIAQHGESGVCYLRDDGDCVVFHINVQFRSFQNNLV